MGLCLWNNMLLLGWRDGKRNGNESEVWLTGRGGGTGSRHELLHVWASFLINTEWMHTFPYTCEQTINTHYSVLFFWQSRITFQSHQVSSTRLTRTRDYLEHSLKCLSGKGFELLVLIIMTWLQVTINKCLLPHQKKNAIPCSYLHIFAGFYESKLKCALWLLCLRLVRPFHSKRLPLTEHSNWNTEGLPHIQLVVSCVNGVVCSRIRLFLILTLSSLI